MTKGQVICLVLADVINRPAEELEAMFRQAGAGSQFDQELSDEEAQELMDNLKSEGSGILAWAVGGVQAALLDQWKPGPGKPS